MTKHLQSKLASHGRLEANDKPTAAQIGDTAWVVKREPARPPPDQHQQSAQQRGDLQWKEEWGGEHAANLCYATDAAKMLRKRLGKDSSRFLDLTDRTDVNMILDLLRKAVAAEEAAIAAASAVDGVEDEPPLPFINGAA